MSRTYELKVQIDKINFKSPCNDTSLFKNSSKST